MHNVKGKRSTTLAPCLFMNRLLGTTVNVTTLTNSHYPVSSPRGLTHDA